jgi:hypothetical protein
MLTLSAQTHNSHVVKHYFVYSTGCSSPLVERDDQHISCGLQCVQHACQSKQQHTTGQHYLQQQRYPQSEVGNRCQGPAWTLLLSPQLILAPAWTRVAKCPFVLCRTSAAALRELQLYSGPTDCNVKLSISLAFERDGALLPLAMGATITVSHERALALLLLFS